MNTRAAMGDIFREGGPLGQDSCFCAVTESEKSQYTTKVYFPHVFCTWDYTFIVVSVVQQMLLQDSDISMMNATDQKALDCMLLWFLKLTFHLKQSTSMQ